MDNLLIIDHNLNEVIRITNAWSFDSRDNVITTSPEILHPYSNPNLDCKFDIFISYRGIDAFYFQLNARLIHIVTHLSLNEYIYELEDKHYIGANVEFITSAVNKTYKNNIKILSQLCGILKIPMENRPEIILSNQSDKLKNHNLW